MSPTAHEIDAAFAHPDEIDCSHGTIYVFDPPPGAVQNTMLEPGELCYASYADERIVDLGALRRTESIDPGDYVGWVSPRCLRVATEEERAGVTIPVIEDPDEGETWFFQVFADPNGHGKVFNIDAEVPPGWADTGFRGTHAQCVKYLGF